MTTTNINIRKAVLPWDHCLCGVTRPSGEQQTDLQCQWSWRAVVGCERVALFCSHLKWENLSKVINARVSLVLSVSHVLDISTLKHSSISPPCYEFRSNYITTKPNFHKSLIFQLKALANLCVALVYWLAMDDAMATSSPSCPRSVDERTTVLTPCSWNHSITFSASLSLPIFCPLSILEEHQKKKQLIHSNSNCWWCYINSMEEQQTLARKNKSIS